MPFKIAQLTDCHLHHNPNTIHRGIHVYQSLQNVLQQLNHLNLDSLIFTGDMAHDERAETYQHYLDLTQSFNQPIYWIPGNHDNPAAMPQTLAQRNWSAAKHLDLGA